MSVMPSPRLASFLALDGLDESTVLAWVASLAAHLPVDGAVAGHSVVVGDAEALRDLGISLERFGDWPDRLARRGEQPLFVAIDGRSLACFGIAGSAADPRFDRIGGQHATHSRDRKSISDDHRRPAGCSCARGRHAGR